MARIILRKRKNIFAIYLYVYKTTTYVFIKNNHDKSNQI